jgi:DNA polymerase III subunit epsilon
VVRVRQVPLVERLTAEELAAHRRFIESLGAGAIWRDYVRSD